MIVPFHAQGVSRRSLLSGAGALVLLAGCGQAAAQSPADIAPALLVSPTARRESLDWKHVLLAGERSILMRRDGPTRRIRYGNGDGSLDRDGYINACHMLRDVRADRTVQIDPELLDVLCGIQRWMDFYGKVSTIEITSGYRTVQTNEAAEGSGRQSMHLYGKAADIIVPGAPSEMIGAMVRRFNSDGGTGIYPGRDFVHVDTGAARTWVSSPTVRRRRKRRN